MSIGLIFWPIGENPGFSSQPVIVRKNPGFPPPSWVKPRFRFKPDKFVGLRSLGYIYINTRYKHIPSRKNSSGDIAYYISADQTLPRNLGCNIWNGTFHEFLEPPGSRLRLAGTQ